MEKIKKEKGRKIPSKSVLTVLPFNSIKLEFFPYTHTGRKCLYERTGHIQHVILAQPVTS